MGKNSFGPLTGAVPGAIASGGIGESARSGRPRPDRPLGRRGADLLAQVPLFEGLSRRHLKQIAEPPVVAIRLFKASFDKVVREEPRVAGKILAAVARRLREAEKTVTA